MIKTFISSICFLLPFGAEAVIPEEIQGGDETVSHLCREHLPKPTYSDSNDLLPLLNPSVRFQLRASARAYRFTPDHYSREWVPVLPSHPQAFGGHKGPCFPNSYMSALHQLLFPYVGGCSPRANQSRDPVRYLTPGGLGQLVRGIIDYKSSSVDDHGLEILAMSVLLGRSQEKCAALHTKYTGSYESFLVYEMALTSAEWLQQRLDEHIECLQPTGWLERSTSWFTGFGTAYYSRKKLAKVQTIKRPKNRHGDDVVPRVCAVAPFLSHFFTLPLYVIAHKLLPIQSQYYKSVVAAGLGLFISDRITDLLYARIRNSFDTLPLRRVQMMIDVFTRSLRMLEVRGLLAGSPIQVNGNVTEDLAPFHVFSQNAQKKMKLLSQISDLEVTRGKGKAKQERKIRGLRAELAKLPDFPAFEAFEKLRAVFRSMAFARSLVGALKEEAPSECHVLKALLSYYWIRAEFDEDVRSFYRTVFDIGKDQLPKDFPIRIPSEKASYVLNSLKASYIPKGGAKSRRKGEPFPDCVESGVRGVLYRFGGDKLWLTNEAHDALELGNDARHKRPAHDRWASFLSEIPGVRYVQPQSPKYPKGKFEIYSGIFNAFRAMATVMCGPQFDVQRAFKYMDDFEQRKHLDEVYLKGCCNCICKALGDFLTIEGQTVTCSVNPLKWGRTSFYDERTHDLYGEITFKLNGRLVLVWALHLNHSTLVYLD